MMKSEFEQIAKRTVTDEQYSAIEALYSASNLDKYEFIKSIRKMLNSIPEEEHKTILTITTTDRCGSEKTPNGCYYHTVKAELVDIEISTGRTLVKEIKGSYELGYTYDLHYYQVTFVGDASNPLFEVA